MHYAFVPNIRKREEIVTIAIHNLHVQDVLTSLNADVLLPTYQARLQKSPSHSTTDWPVCLLPINRKGMQSITAVNIALSLLI